MTDGVVVSLVYLAVEALVWWKSGWSLAVWRWRPRGRCCDTPPPPSPNNSSTKPLTQFSSVGQSLLLLFSHQPPSFSSIGCFLICAFPRPPVLCPVLSCSARPACYVCVSCVLKSHMSCLDFLHSKHLTSNGNWAALSHFSRRRWPLLLLLLLLLLLSSVTCLNSCPPCDSCCVLQSQTPCLDICSTYTEATRPPCVHILPYYYPPFITCLRYLHSKLPLSTCCKQKSA